MFEGSDAFEEARRLVENPDYYEIFDTVVHFESMGEEMDFTLDEVDISVREDGDKRGVIEKGPAKIIVSFDDFTVMGCRVWRVTPAGKNQGIDSLTVEKQVVEDV